MTTLSAIVDDSEMLATFAKVLAETAGSPESYSKIAELLHDRIRGTFREMTDPWGQPWPPHSPVTLAARERAGEASVQMLISKGAMYASIKASSTPQQAVIEAGEGIEYFNVHQFGNAKNKAWGRGSAPIPARPMFPMRDEREAAFPADWLEEVLIPLREAIQEAAQ